MLDRTVINRLAAIAGPGNVISESSQLSAYSYDSHPGYFLPDAVVTVRTTAEIAAVLTLASANRIPVVARGAGSGTTGGSVPERGGIVLNLERMKRIVGISVEDRLGFVQPGVITGEFQRAAAAKGLFYPPEPASSQFSTLGGNVAESAGGLGCVKYGLTKHFVAGLEFVTTHGDIVRTGAFSDRDTPCDAGAAVTGSEGTLAVVTEIALRLVPLPPARVTMAAFFRSLADAGRASNALLSSGAIPSVLEFLDAGSIEAVRDHTEVAIPEGTGAILIAETDGTREEAAAAGEVLERTLRGAGIIKLTRAEKASERESLWTLRTSLNPAVLRLAPLKINEDISVPVSRIPEICEYIERLGRERDVRVVSFGHSGDGNIHVNFMLDKEPSEEADRAHTAVTDLFREVVRVGGTLSGEHGIGITKRPYIKLALDEPTLRFERAIRRAFDPEGVMNPGKMFPAEADATA